MTDYLRDVLRHLSKQLWDVKVAGDLCVEEAYNILLALYPSNLPADFSFGNISHDLGRSYDISLELPFRCNKQIGRYFQGDSTQ
jgi:hypothetical protein